MARDRTREWEEFRKTWSRTGYAAVVVLMMGLLTPILIVAVAEICWAQWSGTYYSTPKIVAEYVGLSIFLSSAWWCLALRAWDRAERVYGGSSTEWGKGSSERRK